MLPVSGQFDADRAQCTTERIADGNALARFLLRRDTEQKAHPPIPMVDDHDTVETPIGTGEANGPRCGDENLGATRRA